MRLFLVPISAKSCELDVEPVEAWIDGKSYDHFFCVRRVGLEAWQLVCCLDASFSVFGATCLYLQYTADRPKTSYKKIWYMMQLVDLNHG